MGRSEEGGSISDRLRELRERLLAMQATGLDEGAPYTAQHLRVTLAQVESSVQQLQRRLQEALDESLRVTQERALQDLVGVIKLAEPGFVDSGQRLEMEAMRRLSEERALLVHQHSVTRYSAEMMETIQQELVAGLATGQTVRQVTDRLTGIRDSVFTTRRWRAELVARMELNSAYNRSHLISLQSARDVLDEPGTEDPLLKRADEYRDTRNHAISRVLHGMVVSIDEPFKVPVAKVHAEHRKLQDERAAKGLPRRRLGGITWPKVDGHYVGAHMPAHFWDRGRIVPHRRSWEDDGSVQVTGGTPPDEAQAERSVADPSVEKQLHDNACGPACAVMMAKDRGVVVDQAPMAEELLSSKELPPELRWAGGISPTQLAKMMERVVPETSWSGGPLDVDRRRAKRAVGVISDDRGSWAALLGKRRRGHWVVVDGLSSSGFVKVRDPSGHRRLYSLDNFVRLWQDQVVVVQDP